MKTFTKRTAIALLATPVLLAGCQSAHEASTTSTTPILTALAPTSTAPVGSTSVAASVTPTPTPTPRSTPRPTPKTSSGPRPVVTHPHTSTAPVVHHTSSPPPAHCYPLTNGGNCYEPGEFCRNSDHGVTGLAGDGKRIKCEDNNGWRWEPI